MTNDPGQAEDKTQAAAGDADASLAFDQLELGHADDSDDGSLWTSFLNRWLDARTIDGGNETAPADAGEVTIAGQAWIDPGTGGGEGTEG